MLQVEFKCQAQGHIFIREFESYNSYVLADMGSSGIECPTCIEKFGDSDYSHPTDSTINTEFLTQKAEYNKFYQLEQTNEII